MRRRGRVLPLAVLTMGWLMLASLPSAPAEPVPPPDLHAGISWAQPESVAEASGQPAGVRLFADPGGAHSLYWQDNGLWHILIDGDGRAISAPKLLGREAPTTWSEHWSPTYFLRDGFGHFHMVWDEDGTEIHYLRLDPRGRPLLPDRIIRTNPCGVHGPSIALAPNGIVVGYISFEPVVREYRYILTWLGPSGESTNEVSLPAGEGLQPLDGIQSHSAGGGVHLVLTTGSGGIYLKVDSSGRVDTRVPLPLLPPGVMPALAIGPDGAPILAWNDWKGQGRGRILASRILNATADTVTITYQAEALSAPSLAVGPGGEGILAWLDFRSLKRESYYAILHPDSWDAYPANQKLGVAAPGCGAPALTFSSGHLFAAWTEGYLLEQARGYSFGFEFSAGDTTATVRPHQTVSMGVELRNLGGLPDTILLELDSSGLPDGWSATLSSGEALLPPGDTALTVTVLVTGPDIAEGSRSGVLKLRAISQGDQRIVQETSLPVSLEVRYGTESLLHPPVLQAPPGGTARFELELRNLGDDADELWLSPGLTSGLTLALEGTRVALDWNSRASVAVWASPPPGANAGDALQFTLTGRSLRSGEIISASATVVVTPGVQLWVSSPDGQKSVAPGALEDFRIIVGNSGNSPGPVEVNLEVVSGAAGWQAELEPAALQLSPGEQQQVRLTITSPPQASGRMVVRVQAYARQWNSFASTTVTAVAIPVHGIVALSGLPRASGLPGTELLVPLTLLNTGSESDEIALGFALPKGWQADAYRGAAAVDRVVLEAGAGLPLTLSVRVPADALAGDYAVRVLFTGRSGASASADFTAGVEGLADLSLYTSTPSLRAAPGDTAVALLHLWNLGNGVDRISVEAEAPAGWTAVVMDSDLRPARQFNLSAGASTSLVLEVGVPYSSPDSWSEISVVATSQSGLRELLSIRVGLLLPDLSLSVSYSPPQFTTGRSVLATVTVFNTGEAPARNVLVGFSVDDRAGQTEQIFLIPAGSNWGTATFSWTPVPGSHLLRFEADTEHTILERDEGNNILLEQVTIEGGAAAPAVASPAIIAAGGASILLVAVGAVGGGTEYGKYWFLSILFIPLYTKIKKDDVLDHFVRGQVYGYIKANPGEHYNSIKKALSLKNGTLVYHLKTLEREEFIKSVVDGRFKRFYPKEMKVPEPSDEIVLRMNHIQHEILKIIKENPGITQKEIAGRIGLSTPTVHYHINIMMSARVINVKRVGRETQCFVEEVEEGRAG